MWFISWNLILARKKQSILSLSGIALGIATFISFAGMLNGFQDYIIDQLVNNDSHVRVSVREELLEAHSLDHTFFPDSSHVFWVNPPSGRRDRSRLDKPLTWIERLSKDPEVLAFSTQYQSQVIFRRGLATKSGRLVGCIPEKQIRVTNIEEYMVEGQFLSLGTSGNRLVMGDGLLKTLGARVGEMVFVAAGKSEPSPFKIIGAFNFGIREIDQSTAFAALVDVQNASRAQSHISDIAVRLVDVELAQKKAGQWSQFSDDKVQSWDQANANILSVFMIQNFMKHFVSIAILIVAAFGIYNILSIQVNQKKRDIGILRAIGYESHDVLMIFLYQGLLFGAAGGFFGLGIGFGICKYMTQIKIGGMMDQLIISFEPAIYVLGLVIAILSSALSSLIPAYFAGTLEPIDIVRSGE
ncbi:MAG: ABC transporter permease [Oligoflexales bacterium]